jgi:hypothetical protein
MDIEIQIVPLPTRLFGIAFSLPRSLTFVSATANDTPVSIVRKHRTLVPGAQLYFLVVNDLDDVLLETSRIEMIVRDRKRPDDISAKCIDRGWRWTQAVRAGLSAAFAKLNSTRRDWRGLANYLSTAARQETRPFCCLDLEQGRIAIVDGLLRTEGDTISCFVFSDAQFRHERCRTAADREENCTLFYLPKCDLAYIDVDGILVLCRPIESAQAREAAETTSQIILSLCHDLGDMPEVEALGAKLTIPSSCTLSTGGTTPLFVDGGVAAGCGAILNLRVEDIEDFDAISTCGLGEESEPLADYWDMLEWKQDGAFTHVFAMRSKPIDPFGLVRFTTQSGASRWVRFWRPETRQGRHVVKGLRFCHPTANEVIDKTELLVAFRQIMTKSSSLLVRRTSFHQELMRSPAAAIIVWDSFEDAKGVETTIAHLCRTCPDGMDLEFTVVSERTQPDYADRLEQLSQRLDMPIALISTPYFARADRIFDHCTKDKLGRVLLVQAGAAPHLSAGDWRSDDIIRLRNGESVVCLAIANLASIDLTSSGAPLYYFDELSDWLCHSAYRSTRIRDSEHQVHYLAGQKPIAKSTFRPMELRRISA